MRCSVLQSIAACCSVLQCVAMCSSVLQRLAMCCSVLQCVAELVYAMRGRIDVCVCMCQSAHSSSQCWLKILLMVYVPIYHR